MLTWTPHNASVWLGKTEDGQEFEVHRLDVGRYILFRLSVSRGKMREWMQVPGIYDTCLAAQHEAKRMLKDEVAEAA